MVKFPVNCTVNCTVFRPHVGDLLFVPQRPGAFIRSLQPFHRVFADEKSEAERHSQFFVMNRLFRSYLFRNLFRNLFIFIDISAYILLDSVRSLLGHVFSYFQVGVTFEWMPRPYMLLGSLKEQLCYPLPQATG